MVRLGLLFTLFVLVLPSSSFGFQEVVLKDVRVSGRGATLLFSGHVGADSVSVETGKGFASLYVKGVSGSSFNVSVPSGSPFKAVYVTGLGDGVKVVFEARKDGFFLSNGFRLSSSGNSLSVSLSGGGQSLQSPGSSYEGSLVYRGLFGIFLVLGIMFPALWAMRKLMSAKRWGKGSGKAIKFLDAHYLSSKQMIAVLEVDGELLVLGVTPDRITTLLRRPRIEEVSEFEKEMEEEGGKIESSMERVFGLIEEKLSSLRGS